MTGSFEISAFQTEVSRIVDEVLTVMFSERAEPLAESSQVGDGYAASVNFVGEWKGALLVRCESSTAEQLTQKLLKLQTVSADDVADAMGELANMIGGNLKSVLPQGVLLSVPTVALANDLAVRVCGSNETKSSLFACGAGRFEVTLIRVVD